MFQMTNKLRNLEAIESVKQEVPQIIHDSQSHVTSATSQTAQ